MTVDLNDAEVQAAIKDAVDAEVQGLKAKNAELLAKVADGKATAGELEEARKLLKEAEDKKLSDEQNWTELEGRLRNEMNEAKAALESKNEALTGSIIERDLMAALVAEKVAPVYIEAAKALMKSMVSLEDGKAVADGKPLNEFIKEWAQTDTGKAFVSAPDNRGGGAPGNNGNRPTTKKFDEMTDVERITLSRENPDAYQKSVAEFKSRQ